MANREPERTDVRLMGTAHSSAVERRMTSHCSRMCTICPVGRFSLVCYALNDIALKLVKFVLFSLGNIPMATMSMLSQIGLAIITVSISLTVCYVVNLFIQRRMKWAVVNC